MNKLRNIHSVTNLAHLFPFIKKKKNLKIWKESVRGIKHISPLFIGQYVISTLTNTGSLLYLTTKNTLPVFGELHPNMHRDMNVSYVTDCNQNWNDLKNFNNNYPISNRIYSAVINLLHAKRQMAKLVVHSQVFFVVKTPNWE